MLAAQSACISPHDDTPITWLPTCALREPDYRPSLTSVTESPQQTKTHRSMLVIDDQPSVRISLEYLLRLAGYNVMGAESGTGAIALAAAESFDGALIDVHMPVMNGFETCLRLQAQATALGRPLRVWFMTGARTRLIERRAVELSSFGVLSKPFDYPAFVERLEQGFASPIPAVPPGADVGDRTLGTGEPRS